MQAQRPPRRHFTDCAVRSDDGCVGAAEPIGHPYTEVNVLMPELVWQPSIDQ